MRSIILQAFGIKKSGLWACMRMIALASLLHIDIVRFVWDYVG